MREKERVRDLHEAHSIPIIAQSDEAMDLFLRLNESIDRLEREVERLSERKSGKSAERMYSGAVAYIKSNPKVWDALKASAEKAIADGSRFSIGREFEELRASEWLEKNEDERFKCDHDYEAVIARMLIVSIPELGKHNELRKSKIDKYFPELRGGNDAA